MPRTSGSATLLNDYTAWVESVLEELAIPSMVIADRALPLVHEARDLVVAETGLDGREHLLVPPAATAWRRLVAAASRDGVILYVVSAYRSVERQAEIIRYKLKCGESLDQILSVSAPPGYSEHHSGRAVDVATPGCSPLEPDFEDTAAFQWLAAHASHFGFSLSFPRGNPSGYLYEPWHWCFHGARTQETCSR